jgi:flagellar motility protein MotE (MotC chaperone)
VKQVRLLPIVVFAAIALLAFKTIGLVTEGGYLFAGIAKVEAEEGGGHEAAATGETDITLPAEPTLADDAPTLTDNAPVLQLAPETPEGGGHGAPEESTVAAEHAEMPAQPVEGHLPDEGCGTEAQCAADNGGAVVVTDATGTKTDNAVSETEKQLLARLADRRNALDALAKELDMRASLVAAAEKRLDERTTELKAMEDRIGAMVDAQKAAEDAQFKSLVSMYETMKPQDAARIFDALDMDVLLRVGRAMNPRKMAPIMAKRTSQTAQALTVRLASADNFDTAEANVAPNDPAALPQIVGH